MRKGNNSVWLQLVLLCAFVVVICLTWLLPVLFTGFTFDLPQLSLARNYLASGQFILTDDIGRLLASNMVSEATAFSAADGRLTAIIAAALMHTIPLTDVVLWSSAAVLIFALSLVGLWLAVRQIFDAKVAWLTMSIAALMPVYFREAIIFDAYNTSFFFVFWSMAAYLWIRTKNEIVAIVISGILFGAAIAAKDVFLVFAPWYFIAYVWHSPHPRMRSALVAGLFFLVAGFVYCAPYASDIAAHGYPSNQNVARLWPGAQTVANQTYLHLYPDPYTYFFDRERFEQEFIASMADKSLHERMMDEKVLLSYGVVESFFRKIRLGGWLVLQDIPALAQRHVFGGVFVWLFILPGALVLWRERRTLLIQIIGLVVSMECIIRFVLGYERLHMMNVAWAFALLAAIGVIHVGKKYTGGTVLISCILLMQLLQTSRYDMAEQYRQSHANLHLVDALALQSAPENAVVAMPSKSGSYAVIHALSDRTVALFREETVLKLSQDDALHTAFQEYGVTHVFGYSPEESARIQDHVPSVTIIDEPESASFHVSGWQSYFLHLLR